MFTCAVRPLRGISHGDGRLTGGRFHAGGLSSLLGFRRPAGVEMVGQDARLGDTILATGDKRLEYQLQVDLIVQKNRPRKRDLCCHARLESIAWGEDDAFAAHHPGLSEAVNWSEFGFGFVPYRQ